MYGEIKKASERAMSELLEKARLQAGGLVVVGCSSSEIVGENIGSASAPDAAGAVLDGILPLIEQNGLYLAAQCCEHLNRALVVERVLAERRGYEIVCAVPKPKAGGSFAAAAYLAFADPVLVEHVRADAGLDIGSTLIGMHLKDVAVPVRLSDKNIGAAYLTAARTRPRLIGGERAEYK